MSTNSSTEPRPLTANEWSGVGGKWACPTIWLPDRVSLIKILRLCGHIRFQEVYAFLEPTATANKHELASVLSTKTQQFNASDAERMLQVWKHVKFMHKKYTETYQALVILEFPFQSGLNRGIDMRKIIENGSNVKVTLLVVESIVTEYAIANAAAVVVNKNPNPQQVHVMWQTCFRSVYAKEEDFMAAWAVQQTHGLRLVFVNQQMGSHLSEVCSLSIDNTETNQDVFTLQIPSRFANDMEETERNRYMSALLSGEDAFVTQDEALQLFRMSRRAPAEFRQSRHVQAMMIYSTWLSHVYAELLAITDTVYGHFPRVLCTLVEAYV
jgi:hypothetical protein